MNPDLPKTPKLDLEERLTALLLGELTEVEATALRDWVATNPEAGRAMERLQQVVTLLREAQSAKAGETPAETLRLSDSRRGALLQQFKTVQPAVFRQPVPQRRSQLLPISIAAAFFIVLLGATNILKMAHPSLQPALRNALHLAEQGELTLRQEVMLEEVEGLLAVSFSVRPLHIAKHNALPCLLVSFQEVMKRTKSRASKGEDLLQVTGHDEQLARELAYTKLSLETTIQSQQATNEALQSANEELQSTNEELQSSNEELETSREELQSMNEETVTINSELNDKVEQLNDIQNDLKNLLDNVNTGVIFLDYKLNIRRYTRDSTKVYRLIASDVGRPLGDITSNLEDENLPALLGEVLDTLVPQNLEVRTLDGTWYLLRIQPYRTLSNMIEGLVLSFTDITLNREATKIKETAAQIALNLAEGIVNTISEPLLVLDGSMQVVSASHSFYQHFQVAPENTVGQKIYALGNGQWNIPALRNLLENILPQQQVMEGFVVEHNFPHLGNHRIVLNARRIVTALGDTELILLAMVTVEVAN